MLGTLVFLISMILIGVTSIYYSARLYEYSFRDLELETEWASSFWFTENVGFRIQIEEGHNYGIIANSVFENYDLMISNSSSLLTGYKLNPLYAMSYLVFIANYTGDFFIYIALTTSADSQFTIKVCADVSDTTDGTLEPFVNSPKYVYDYNFFFIFLIIGIIPSILINIIDEINISSKNKGNRQTYSKKIRSFSSKKPFYSAIRSLEGVSLKRQFEYLSGFVRIKVKILNNSNYLISRVKFELDVPKSFVIRKIEPSYQIEAGEVEVDEIPPNSSKTIGYTLEPLICGREKLYANLEYLDYRGDHKVIVMNPLVVEVICPLFFTEEDANIATLTNLITYKLKKNDERSYALPEKLSPQKAYEIVKSVIQKHHIKFVSENVDEKPNYEAHAWYYGRSKISQKEFVIQGIVSSKNKSIKIMVDCEDEISLVGFLSELGGDLRKGILREGIISYEEDLVALRCPACAAPLAKFPKVGEAFKCNYCNSLVTLE